MFLKYYVRPRHTKHNIVYLVFKTVRSATTFLECLARPICAAIIVDTATRIFIKKRAR